MLTEVSFEQADGRVLLDHVTAAFGTGRVGLVGRNGAGKTTLLSLIAGDLVPTTGHLQVTGEVGRLPQDLLSRSVTVADLLGVGEQWAALRRIEGGSAADRDFEIVGDDWDVAERSRSVLERIGLTGLDPDRSVERLSGGEAVLTALAGLHLRRSPITLLDEPTNNLDLRARGRLTDLVRVWPGVLVVVSHDTALLEEMAETVELRDGALTVFGGPFSAFTEHVHTEQEAVRRDLRAATQQLRAQQRQRQDLETALARRSRQGRTAAAEHRYPRIVAGTLQRRAETSAARGRAVADDRITRARDRVSDQERLLRDDDRVVLDLPDPQVPRSRRLIEIDVPDPNGPDRRTLVLQGPERVALLGDNGTGKSTLVRRLLPGTDPTVPAVLGDLRVRALTDRVGLLDQALGGLDDTVGAMEELRRRSADLPDQERRNLLAQLLIRGDDVHRPIGTLSGGERFRVALAAQWVARPVRQLLVLDEPTNNLDLDTVEVLIDALAQYRGGLLVVSHDLPFLRRLGLDQCWHLASAPEGPALTPGDLP